MSSALLNRFSIYMNTGAGSENVLRLLQYTCVLVQSLSVSSTTSWARAGQQFALGRRYFRYFKFIDCFRVSWEKFSGTDVHLVDRGAVALTIETCRWSALGCYLLLEAFTILDALGVQTTYWGAYFLLESNKFWFYALALEILGLLWRLIWLRSEYHVPKGLIQTSTISTEVKAEKERERSNSGEKEAKESHHGNIDETERSTKQRRTTPAQMFEEYSIARRNSTKRLFVTSCDILIPGHIIGWIRVSASTMGAAAILSTLIVGRERWIKAQNAAKE